MKAFIDRAEIQDAINSAKFQAACVRELNKAVDVGEQPSN